MNTAQTHRRLPRFQFRVLVIGRANAGKTSILQRVCETTESPTIYRDDEEVRGPSFCPRVGSYYSGCRQVTLNPTMNVSDPPVLLFGCL
jgi:GTPase SAR1 family protein